MPRRPVEGSSGVGVEILGGQFAYGGQVVVAGHRRQRQTPEQLEAGAGVGAVVDQVAQHPVLVDLAAAFVDVGQHRGEGLQVGMDVA